MNIGEFELIDIIKKSVKTPDGVVGIGDDCAIIPQIGGQDSLISCDMLVEGSHFLLSDISPYQLGWKSAAVNISDIAAMGGKPQASFLSLALSDSVSSDWLREFMRGYNDISERFSSCLLGGDTTASKDKVCINVTVIGTCTSSKAICRNAAKIGDKICVTGFLGDSAAGLKFILDPMAQGSMKNVLVERHYMPMPRVEEAQILAQCPGIHSLMDISDGIASDLRHIIKASGVGAEIDINSLPLSGELKAACEQNDWDAIELALTGGEDYELLFTASPTAQIPIPHTVIGTINDTDTIQWLGSDKDYQGFRHF